MEMVRLAAASIALRACAPSRREPAANAIAGTGTLLRPHVEPQRLTAQSEAIPPSGITIRLSIQGRVAQPSGLQPLELAHLHEVKEKPEYDTYPTYPCRV